MNADKVTTCQPLWGHCGPLHSAILEIIAHEQLHLFALWSWQRLRFYSFSFFFLRLIYTLNTPTTKLISFGHCPRPPISKSIPFIRISCLIILWSQHKRCFPAVWTWKAINVQKRGNNFIIQHQGGFDGRRQRSCKCNYVDFYKVMPPCWLLQRGPAPMLTQLVGLLA